MKGKQKRILLFEEDFESMRDLKEHLEKQMGWDVELTADRSLLERLSHERFDLILVDLMIHPTCEDVDGKEVQNVHFDGVNWHKTGLEFLRRLRRGEFSEKLGLGTSPDVPAIILSAVASYSVTDELGEDVHLNGYLEKPFRMEEVVEKIRGLLQEQAMPIPREAPMPSDSLRDAKKYHRLLLALERATGEIRAMERKDSPDIDEVLDELLPDLANALNAEQAFAALLREDEGTGEKWLELTVAHPRENLGYRLECTGWLQQLIEDGKPKVIDSLGEESPTLILELGVFEATSAVLVRMQSADQVRVVGICNKSDPDLGPYLAADGKALDSLVELVAIGARVGEQLSRTDAVALMGAWGADVVHDVNREVGAIRRVIYLLQQRPDLPSETKEHLQEIDRYARSLALPELPEQAPESGRILEFRGAPLLDKVIRTEIVAFQRVHPSVSWQLDLNCSEIRVAMHEQWLRRLVRHLIRNAVRAIPFENETRLVTVRTRAQDSMAEIQVEDTGKGVRPEIERLLFRRPIPHPDGRPGRGLILVRFVAEQYGGEIRLIWSRPGEGACFAFSIPLAQPEADSERPVPTRHLPQKSDEQSRFGR